MFRFFRKQANVNEPETETGYTEEVDPKVTVTPSVSVHPEWKIPEEDYYFYLYHNAQLGGLFPREFAVDTLISRKRKNGGVVIRTLIRNGMQKPVHPGPCVAVVYQKDGTIVAQAEKDLSGMGVIPASSSRPWRFEFSYEETVRTGSDPETWQVALVPDNIPVRQDVLLPEEWLEGLGAGDREELTEELEALSEKAPFEAFTVEGVDVVKDEEGLDVSVILHNRTHERFDLTAWQFTILDAQGVRQFTGRVPEGAPGLNRYTSMLLPLTVPKRDLEADGDWTAFSVELRKSE